MAQYKGIDIASMQGHVDFNKVKAAGYSFVIIKATEGSEAGSHYINPYFRESVRNAEAAGLAVHIYHFFRGISDSDARSEADWFLKNLAGINVKGYLFCDVEAKNLNPNAGTLTGFVNAFFDQLAKAGHAKLGIYSGLYFFRDRLTESALRPGLLKWIAQYNDHCDRKADIWQHRSDASVPGINGRVDENIAYTSAVASASAPAAKPANKPTSKPKPASKPSSGTYKVRPGDTLSAIAGRLGTNVQALAALNGIRNVNLIKPGQVLRLKKTNHPAKPAASGTYTVRSGDTLSAIAAKHGTTVSRLAALNGIRNPNVIRVGQVLKLSGSAAKRAGRPYHKVASGDTLWDIAQRHHTTVQQLKNKNHLSTDTIYPGQKIYL
ncbi:LysM peptidoglycan-binding domain-containing protein [Sporolactobacillus sp. CQH2019]|uniref:LysM peptidoglycan-binding domain-containing protein n=1 Tax=Sporolactobacillus sp. CQH2019 TaxID=3023512 RepID=UPI0023674E0F|nr:LysM peptidoglycan-binding domain-containing protein [Sporolactobacillus sp. CQH2019]MDD9148171.1 LysM peptidoglycan-binding domain-containing protein [Sporolactobacillus sp. CQH2019]